MTYNFEEIITRRGTNCVKWDESDDPDVLPLWVADMDFRTYPPIIEALHERVEHGIFGYTHVPESYYNSVLRWFGEHHGVSGYVPGDIIVTSGVVPAISAIVRALTLPADKVLMLTPVYNCFFSSIRNQGCLIEASPLVYEDNTYHVDWEDFERRCADPRVRLFLLCSPHNPAGRVWTRDELLRFDDICRRNGVFVVADEIHCEIVMPGQTHCSFGSLSDEARQNSALCVAPTKAFNIAGLQIADILVADPQKRDRIDRAINLHEVCDVNPFGVVATEAAYTDGGWEWLRQLNEYIFGNYEFLCHFVRQQFHGLSVVRLEGTYLAWLDCSALGVAATQLADHLLRSQHVWFNDGEMYGETKRSFLRINLACPRTLLAEGLRRLAEGIRTL